MSFLNKLREKIPTSSQIAQYVKEYSIALGKGFRVDYPSPLPETSLRQGLFFYIAIPAIVLGTAGIIIAFDFFGNQEIVFGDRFEKYVTIGDTMFEGKRNEPGMVFLETRVFSDITEPNTVSLDLKSARIVYNQSGSEDEIICMSGLFITFLDEEEILGPIIIENKSSPDYRFDPPFCSKTNIDDMFASREINSSGPIVLDLKQSKPSERMYPFDKWQSQRLLIYPLLWTDEGEAIGNIPINVSADSNLPDWEEEVSLDAREIRVSENERFNGQASLISLTVSRTKTQRLLTLILLIFSTVFILGLPFVNETGTLLEVIVGILLGLWGIQAILIPNDIRQTTLVHFWIIILYVLLGIVAYLRLIARPMLRRIDKERIFQTFFRLRGDQVFEYIDAFSFAAEVFNQMSPPWSDDIVLDVFITIEGDIELLERYNQLVDDFNKKRSDGQNIVNSIIVDNVVQRTGRKEVHQQQPALGSSLIDSYSKLG